MKKLIGICCLTLAGLSLQLHAADAVLGKQKSATCTACHGKEGISSNPTWPNLAGQHAPYLVLQLKAFKEGSRKNATMNAIVQTLTNEDMHNIAAYFESL